jgi:hypothetical protein
MAVRAGRGHRASHNFVRVLEGLAGRPRRRPCCGDGDLAVTATPRTTDGTRGGRNGHAYLATVGDPGNALVFNPNGVYTGSAPAPAPSTSRPRTPGGGLSAGIPFHLTVICPAAASTKIAVVKASGLPSRGSSLTSSFRPSTGQYTLATSTPLPACAAIAIRGSVNTSVPFDPATVETTGGPAPNTTGIQVRQLLFFAGNLASESFHAAMIC